MALTTRTEYVNGVVIRPYEDRDSDAVCSLYQDVFAVSATTDWLTWKFTNNRYANQVPLMVAEVDGEVKGVQGYIPFPLAGGGETLDAALLVDAMVHPDYQGTGIYSKLAKPTIALCEETSDVLFSFLNETAEPIFQHWGWTRVGPAKTHYRIQDPGAFVRAAGPIGSIATVLSRTSRTRRDRRVKLAEKLAIEETDGVFIDDLVVLSRKSTPDRLHIPRDERFYTWRFGNPQDQWVTYTATRYGVPLASLITRMETVRGRRELTLFEVAPLEGGADRVNGLRRILMHICEKHADVACIAAPDGMLPAELLVEFGFRSGDARTLKLLLGNPEPVLYVHTPKPLDVDVANATGWLLSCASRNTT